jgi:mRNA-degrading endonuclease RelE of RelBE toxin-antitoxin system
MNITTTKHMGVELTSPARVEVLYERSFVQDLKHLKPAASEKIQQFVFSDFFETTHLQVLPEFRQLGNSKIFYRFTWENHLISIEVTGQIIKFIRVLPKPPV